MLNLLSGSLEPTLFLSAGMWFVLIYMQTNINGFRQVWNPVALLSLDGLAQTNMFGALLILMSYSVVSIMLIMAAWKRKAL